MNTRSITLAKTSSRTLKGLAESQNFWHVSYGTNKYDRQEFLIRAMFEDVPDTMQFSVEYKCGAG